MADRVTIQDIADALGVSRNTVSKAINNTGLLADATRERVLKKAVEMGYKQFSYVNIYGSGKAEVSLPPETDKREISLFTSSFIGNSHFASTMLDKFQRELSGLGYGFTMHRLQEHEIENLSLPSSYNEERTAGIICVEMFNKDYCHMLCKLDTPTLFVDTPVADLNHPLKSDCLYMDNQTNIGCFVSEMIRRGKNALDLSATSHTASPFMSGSSVTATPCTSRDSPAPKNTALRKTKKAPKFRGIAPIVNICWKKFRT